jgi:GAF domain-containing protein
MQLEQQPAEPLVGARSPKANLVADAIKDVEDMWRSGTPRRVMLARLATAGEVLAGPDAVVSILVLNEEGLLRNGASPNLPADYLDAIDRLKPDPNLGTCAAAAATGLVVVTPDFLKDDKWGELRHLPLALGFVGAWSTPIKSTEGVVLGTFGTYFRTHRLPTVEERRGVALLAAAAAAVLAKEANERGR